MKLYVYPWRDPADGAVVTAESLHVASRLRHLYAHLLENHFIEPIRDFCEEFLGIYPPDVRAKIKTGDPAWEEMVPRPVVEIIQRDKLFGWKDHR